MNRKDRRAQAARQRHASGPRVDPRAEAARQRHAAATVGMDLRYGGRTVVVTAYVNTSEDPEDVIQRVQPASRGPRQAMAIATAAVAAEDAAAALWKALEINTLFGGRTVVITCYVNTDEKDLQALSDRVLSAANTPTDSRVRSECQGQLAVTTTVAEPVYEDAKPLWQQLFKMVDAQKEGPN